MGVTPRRRALLSLWPLLTALVATPGVCAPPTEPLWLEAELGAETTYLQAQALYTLRLYRAVDLRDARIHGPAPAPADLRPIGTDRVYEATRDGRRYRVTERRYAVIPFVSGPLVLEGAHAEGLAMVPGAKPPGTRRTVRLDAPTRTLTVLPIPLPEGTPWLPARALALTESWSAAPDTARLGEPLRRTLRIEAVGIDAAQLPEVTFAAEGLAVHPEPPQLTTRFEGDWAVATREQSFRVVPIRHGSWQLSALRLPWWDVTTGRPAEAVLPPHRFHLPLPAPAAAAEPPERTAVVGGVVALALGVALAGWWAGRYYAQGSARRALRRACRAGDAGGAQRALLAWAAANWPEDPPASLAALAERAPGLQAQLVLLERHLYGLPGGSWNGQALWHAWRRQARPAPAPPPGPLPPLYPR